MKLAKTSTEKRWIEVMFIGAIQNWGSLRLVSGIDTPVNVGYTRAESELQ